MLGQPVSMLVPQVVGFKLHGQLPRGGDGDRPRADRHRDARAARAWSASSSSSTATAWPTSRWPTGRRSPTWRPSTARPAAIFPIDAETLRYLELSGRRRTLIALVEAYAKAQGLFSRGRRARGRVHRHAGARPLDGRAEPRRAQAAPGPRRPRATRRTSFQKALKAMPTTTRPPRRGPAGDGPDGLGHDRRQAASPGCEGEGGGGTAVGGRGARRSAASAAYRPPRDSRLRSTTARS